MSRRRSNEDLRLSSGVMHQGVFDAASLDKAIQADKEILDIQGKTLSNIAAQERLMQSQYEFDRRVRVDQQIEEHGQDIAQQIAGIDHDSPDALDQINDIYANAPQGSLAHASIQPLLKSKMHQIDHSNRKRSARMTANAGAIDAQVADLVKESPSLKQSGFDVSKRLIDAKSVEDQDAILKKFHNQFAEQSIDDANLLISEQRRTYNDYALPENSFGRIMAEKVKAPQGDDWDKLSFSDKRFYLSQGKKYVEFHGNVAKLQQESQSGTDLRKSLVDVFKGAAKDAADQMARESTSVTRKAASTQSQTNTPDDEKERGTIREVEYQNARDLRNKYLTAISRIESLPPQATKDEVNAIVAELGLIRLKSRGEPSGGRQPSGIIEDAGL